MVQSRCWRFSGVPLAALLVYASRVFPTVDASGVVAFNSARGIMDAGMYGTFAAIPMDHDQDGDVDIIATHTWANRVVLYTNDGTGAFSAGSDMSEYPQYRPR